MPFLRRTCPESPGAAGSTARGRHDTWLFNDRSYIDQAGAALHNQTSLRRPHWGVFLKRRLAMEDYMDNTGAVEEQVTDIVTTASDLDHTAVYEIGHELRHLLADTFALYIKTKNFHWHMKGRHFRDYHLLLDEHAGQLFEMTDEIAERARKIGAGTLRSIGDITRHQRLQDSDRKHVEPREMLAELTSDTRQLTRFLRQSHKVCERHSDVASTSLMEVWIDQAERRAWFLAEIIGE